MIAVRWMAVIGTAGCVALACAGESKKGRRDASEGGTSNGATSGGGTGAGGTSAGGTGAGGAGAGGIQTGGVPNGGASGGTVPRECPWQPVWCDPTVVMPPTGYFSGPCAPEDQGKLCDFHYQILPHANCDSGTMAATCCNGMWRGAGGPPCPSTGGAPGTGGEAAGGEGGAGFGGAP